MNLNSWQTHILYIFSTYSLASWGQAKVRRRSGEAHEYETRLGQSHLHQNLFPLGGEGGVLRLLDGNVRDVKGTRRMLATVIDSDRAR